MREIKGYKVNARTGGNLCVKLKAIEKTLELAEAYARI
jgi:hypothetical protein